MINDNKHLFQDFCYLISHMLLIYPLNHCHFCHVGLSSFIFMHKGRGKTWSIRSCDLMAIVDLHLSEGVRSTFLLGDDTFYNI